MALPAGVDPIVFDALKKEYEASKVVVFAGAGVSMGAGLPSWKRLAELLVSRMRAANRPADAIDEAEELLHKGDLVNALSVARHALRNEFDHVLSRALDDDGRDVPEVATAIAALAPKLAGVVTTNIDRLLERALGGAWPPVLEPVANLLQRPRYLFKPHGTVDDPDTWVFTRDEYDRAMFGSQALQDLFWSLYGARTLLFVGASLTDDDFGLTLGRVRAVAGRNHPTHYAILPAPIRPLRQRHLEDAGIRLLVYENASTTHHEVVQILQALAGAAVSPPVAAPPAAAPPPPPTPAAAPPAAAPRTAAAGPVAIYISASPKDLAFRDKLVAQLAQLEKRGRIRLAHEGLVRAGEDRKKVLTTFFDRATIVLALLSADYLASEEHDAELQRALTRSRAGTATLIPVLLRPALWQTAFGGHDLQPVPDKPITTFSNTDDALLKVVEAVVANLPPT